MRLEGLGLRIDMSKKPRSVALKSRYLIHRRELLFASRVLCRLDTCEGVCLKSMARGAGGLRLRIPTNLPVDDCSRAVCRHEGRKRELS